jgi:flagellar hook-length control protein FliK
MMTGIILGRMLGLKMTIVPMLSEIPVAPKQPFKGQLQSAIAVVQQAGLVGIKGIGPALAASKPAGTVLADTFSPEPSNIAFVELFQSTGVQPLPNPSIAGENPLSPKMNDPEKVAVETVSVESVVPAVKLRPSATDVDRIGAVDLVKTTSSAPALNLHPSSLQNEIGPTENIRVPASATSEARPFAISQAPTQPASIPVEKPVSATVRPIGASPNEGQDKPQSVAVAAKEVPAPKDVFLAEFPIKSPVSKSVYEPIAQQNPVLFKAGYIPAEAINTVKSEPERTIEVKDAVRAEVPKTEQRPPETREKATLQTIGKSVDALQIWPKLATLPLQVADATADDPIISTALTQKISGPNTGLQDIKTKSASSVVASDTSGQTAPRPEVNTAVAELANVRPPAPVSIKPPQTVTMALPQIPVDVQAAKPQSPDRSPKLEKPTQPEPISNTIQAPTAEPLQTPTVDAVKQEIPVQPLLKSESPPSLVSTQAAVSMPKNVAIQLVQAAPTDGGQTVEIALDPVELGKVRLTLQTSETGINVQILADRPETIDLLRRNMHLLEAEFDSIGYQDIGFEFSQSQQDATQDNAEGLPQWPDDHETQNTDVSTTQPSYGKALPIGAGLDLRL